MIFNPITLARLFVYVREAGANNGQRVNGFQIWCGGKDALGTSWCCWFATWVLDVCFQGNSPIPRLGLVQDVYDLAAKNGWVSFMHPLPGDLVVYLDANGHAHHIGFFCYDQTTPTQWNILAGNTSADGASSNGDRVAEHELHYPRVAYIHYPR